ncbi:MAG: hypothetical protein LIO78_09570 [Clostridiales bacterium]|nr:hypothetical protein [Clostridiales bacterium]MCC8151225.1 hypothetical protein [Lachnospiraceae bacterium]
MLKLTDLKIAVDESIGSTLLLVDVTPRYEYRENVRTDKIAGYGYTIVTPEKSFEKLTVKIDGKKLLEPPDEGYEQVWFDNLELYIYWARGQYSIGARATGIHPVLDTTLE